MHDGKKKAQLGSHRRLSRELQFRAAVRRGGARRTHATVSSLRRGGGGQVLETLAKSGDPLAVKFGVPMKNRKVYICSCSSIVLL